LNPTEVKTTLTTCRSTVENDAYDAFARRIVRAYARRVGDGDVEALEALITLTNDLDTAIHNPIGGVRAFGYSWAEIASRLGISRQGAWQRWNTEPASHHADEGDAR
jgi:hypothetical protein